MEKDEFGPEQILEVSDEKVGMKGVVVIDNTKLGPGKGGIRMTPTVSVEEVAKLARAMTWKNALAELPFGGAKSGIIANSKELTTEQKKAIVEAFSRALKVVCPSKYIAAPDMYMPEQEMGWFAKANGDMKSCTGKPKELGGLPHELGSTGFGVFHAVRVGAEHLGMDLKNSTVAIEGFGNVGWFVAKHLSEFGAKIVAVSDSKGVIYDSEGIDFEELANVKKETRSVVNYRDKKVDKSIIEIDADILVTAAVPDLIKEGDVDGLKFKLIVEGSNIPISSNVEEMCYKKGILVIPDFVANAGGVISSYVEYTNGTAEEMFKMVEEKIIKNTKIILENAKSKSIMPRQSAMEIAKQRIKRGE